MKKHLVALTALSAALQAFLVLAPGVAYATDLNLTVTSKGSAKLAVQPGQFVEYEVTGVLSDAGSQGLGLFMFDLSFSGGELEPADAPVLRALQSFIPPAGYTNSAGYGGTPVDGVLRQIGGVQNTLKAPWMTGPVVTGVGHTPTVLATGTLTAPMTNGVYTLAASDVLARVIKKGEDGSGPTWATEYAWQGTRQPFTLLVGEGACATVADCADQNGDGLRDDPCVWWACNAGACESMDIVFADVGGQFGNCLPDGTADGNDRFHALGCFSNVTVQGSPGYPCESSPPAALNVDAGSPFGGCSPDGVCDGNDAFHAVNAFSGLSLCSCDPGPSPVVPEVVAQAALELRPSRRSVKSGDVVEVDVFLMNAVPDLRGYQLHLKSGGGTRGGLDLVDIVVYAANPDYVFAGLAPWQAFNVATEQMVAGLDGPGVATRSGAYLATFVYGASSEARGAFTVELQADYSDRSQRTFLFPALANGWIVIEAQPAEIDVLSARGRVVR